MPARSSERTVPPRPRAGGAKRGDGQPPAASRRRATPRAEPRLRRRKDVPGDGSRSARGDAMPATFIPAMKALSVETVPAGDWRLEIKLDGYRAIAVLKRGQVELWSRNHKPLDAYPEINDALARLPCVSAVLDGEIVALDAAGRSRFQLLQGRSLAGARPTLVYYVFDLLQQDGRSWLNAPLEQRQEALAALVKTAGGSVRLSPVFAAEPEALLAAARAQGLEGIIAKAAGSLYEPDRRSGAWLKCKVHGEQEFVIGGFTAPKNSRAYFGALLVGYFKGGQLRYAGKVGTGFDFARLRSLSEAMAQHRTDSCPFVDLPSPRRSRFGVGMTAGAMRAVTWVRPELVAQVRFTEWTDDGLLRHPVFLGLRTDKAAKDVVRESGAAAPSEAAHVSAGRRAPRQGAGKKADSHSRG